MVFKPWSKTIISWFLNPGQKPSFNGKNHGQNHHLMVKTMVKTMVSGEDFPNKTNPRTPIIAPTAFTRPARPPISRRPGGFCHD